jgi:TIR domain
MQPFDSDSLPYATCRDPAEPEGERVDRKISVFLSYRRADTPYAAGRLGDRLGERFELFMDIDIAPGLHFGQALNDAVSSCDVMLVLIGPSWLTAVDDDGRSRLQNPRDWVVQEIEAALARDVTVIPVLVDGARMPLPEQLPEQLESLAFRQAVSLRHESFNSDITTLLNAIEQAVPTGLEDQAGGPRDRNVEQRLVNAWRQLRGEEVATAQPAAPRAGSSVRPELPITGQAVRVLLILIGVSYLTLVVWSLPLSSPQDLEDSLVPLVLMIAVTVGFLPMMWWGARHYPDRRHLWRSAVLYAGVAVPIGLVLAVVTKYVSSVNPLFWLLLYAVAMIPGGLAYAMVRARHSMGALWAATLAYLVAVSTLLVSAVWLA